MARACRCRRRRQRGHGFIVKTSGNACADTAIFNHLASMQSAWHERSPPPAKVMRRSGLIRGIRRRPGALVHRQLRLSTVASTCGARDSLGLARWGKAVSASPDGEVYTQDDARRSIRRTRVSRRLPAPEAYEGLARIGADSIGTLGC